MNIVIWRHADAATGNPDAARPLTERGRRQASVVARWLSTHLPKPCRVIGSPAVRARDTAAALTNEYGECAELGYGLESATGQAVLDAANWPKAEGTVIFVGHQPTVGRAVGLLLTGTQIQCEVFGGSAWWFSNEMPSFENRVLLRAVVSPEFLGGD